MFVDGINLTTSHESAEAALHLYMSYEARMLKKMANGEHFYAIIMQHGKPNETRCIYCDGLIQDVHNQKCFEAMREASLINAKHEMGLST